MASSSGGRGGQVGILTRGGITGKFAAAAGGRRDEAYEPAQSPQSNMLSALTGGRPQIGQHAMNERNGPSSVVKQDYRNVPPPPDLTRQGPSATHRGRGRGARGGLGSVDGGRGRGAFRGQGHVLGHTNGSYPASASDSAAASMTSGVNGHTADVGTSTRGTTRGGLRGRGRGGNARGQSARGTSKAPDSVGSGPAPAPTL